MCYRFLFVEISSTFLRLYILGGYIHYNGAKTSLVEKNSKLPISLRFNFWFAWVFVCDICLWICWLQIRFRCDSESFVDRVSYRRCASSFGYWSWSGPEYRRCASSFSYWSRSGPEYRMCACSLGYWPRSGPEYRRCACSLGYWPRSGPEYGIYACSLGYWPRSGPERSNLQYSLISLSSYNLIWWWWYRLRFMFDNTFFSVNH